MSDDKAGGTITHAEQDGESWWRMPELGIPRRLPHGASPHPHEEDVHLSVTVAGMKFHYAACISAALTFVQEQGAHHYTVAVEVVRGDTRGLPRLPNERLFLEP
ncbi:hypothetical protein D5S18_02420 [Nocardia panacis]|uniref:Uncharacterized protein n=1 Tax=Nocardia panacis TaxID=2340916 RepID=A0A3A4KZ30_9NOCA|nr:hypothetical protein [Nocardia panacis]RJO79214.1 hypothetical protein D5S18_02420 [Nocardia panacis]